MSALPPDASTRLVKLCGMLGSEHAGERASAGLKASELLRQHGVDWSDVLGPDPDPVFVMADPKAERRARYPEWQGGPPEPVRLLKEHQQRSFRLLHSGYDWSDWERDFLSGIYSQRWAITNKQDRKLLDLRAKVDEWRKRRDGAA